MSQILDEQLSAFLDGELPPEEIDLLLARLDRDPQQRATLGRYAMIGECIRTGVAAPAALGMAERVRTALAADAGAATAPGPSGARHPAGAFGWVGGTLAASVAVVALLLAVPGIWRPAGPTSPGPAAAIPADPDVAMSAGPEPIPDVSAFASRRLAPDAAARLTGYMMAHVEYASPISRSSFDSRLVSARAERASWRQPQDPGYAR